MTCWSNGKTPRMLFRKNWQSKRQPVPTCISTSWCRRTRLTITIRRMGARTSTGSQSRSRHRQPAPAPQFIRRHQLQALLTCCSGKIVSHGWSLRILCVLLVITRKAFNHRKDRNINLIATRGVHGKAVIALRPRIKSQFLDLSWFTVCTAWQTMPLWVLIRAEVAQVTLSQLLGWKMR